MQWQEILLWILNLVNRLRLDIILGLNLGMITNDNDVLKTKENEIYTKDKTEPQQIHGKVSLYVNNK